MYNLPIFVGLDYYQKSIQVCVMNQKRKILANVTIVNDPAATVQSCCSAPSVPATGIVATLLQIDSSPEWDEVFILK